MNVEPIDPNVIRLAFRAAGESIEQDKKCRTYDLPGAKDISFLAKEPFTPQEIAECLFEQLRSAGLNFYIDETEVKPEEHMSVYMIRKLAVSLREEQEEENN